MLAYLRVSEAVVAVASMIAGVIRRFARRNTAEERLEGPIYPQYHILQDLAVHICVLRHGLLDVWQFRLLLIIGDGDTALVPGFPALLNGGVIDIAREHQHTLKFPLLLWSGFEFVFVGFADTLLFHVKLFCLIAT